MLCLSAFRLINKRRYFSSFAAMHNKVAVVLSGCGVYDGSEIHETSAVLVHLSRNGVEPVMYAPDADQMHVVNHIKGEPVENEKRNSMVEAARIARGNIKNLDTLNSSDFDAVVFPGGFGVAKNLSNFAVDGQNCKIDENVEKIIKDFHGAKKPIGLCCISPILAAKVLNGVQITLGCDKDDGSGKWPYAGAAEAAKSWGANHKNCDVNEIVVDEENKVVTTPAFMCGVAKFHEIHDGVGNMIQSLLKMSK